MATPSRAEYIELDGVPLSTPAWEVTDHSELWDLAEIRGGSIDAPYRRGIVPFRRTLGGKRAALDLAITGDLDSDGNPPATNARAQLWTNRNELVRDALRPPTIGLEGTRLLRYHAPDGDIISGPAQIIGGLRPQPLGPTNLIASIDVLLTDGGLRSETVVDVTSAEVAGGALDTLVVPNPGTDYQDTAILTLTGTATSVTLTNRTADAAGSVSLDFNGSLDAGVTINTGLWTATRGGLSVVTLVDFDGFERWLPLLPGDNDIDIEPSGGTTTLRVEHFPFFA